MLNNLIKNRADKSALKQLANAKVVLPKEIFDLSDFNQSQSNKATTDNQQEIFNNELETTKNIEFARVKIRAIENILDKLNYINKEHQKKYNKEYQKQLKAYQEKNKPLIEKYLNDYAAEYRKLYKQLKNHEEVRILIDIPQPKINEFTFNYPAEPDIKNLSKLLEKETFEYLSGIIDLNSIDTFSEIINQLERTLKEQQNIIVNNQKLTQKMLVFGDSIIPEIPTTHGYFSYNICALLLQDKPNKVGFSVSIVLPNLDLTVTSFLYSLATVDGTNTNAYFTSTKNANIITLRNLFNDSISDSIEGKIEKFSGRITFSNGQTYNFEIKPFSITSKPPYGKCFKGILQANTNDESPAIEIPDIDKPFIPSKFGYRQLGIADYKKVVTEVCCYETGEVAHIENIMAREMREKITTQFHQRQIIETETNEIETEKITDSTSTERFALQTEIAKLLQEQKKFNANVNIHSSWGVTTLDASAGYASNISKEESNRQAVQQSKEITERAMERIVTKTKNKKTISTTDEFTEENAHRFDNTTGSEHVSGVFRFINAIYKNQIYNYGKRLMYEFVIPQPSKLHRLALAIKQNSEQFEKPVDPRDLGYTDFSTINESNYLHLASAYNADVETHKQKTIYVSQHYLKEDWSNDGRWHKSGEFTIKIPENYQVKNVRGYFDPKNGNHNATWNNMYGTIYIGSQKITIPHRTSDMEFDITFSNEVIENELSLTLTTWDIATYNFNFIVKCELTEKAHNDWKKNTYEAILAGYEEQLRIYNEKLTQSKSAGIQILDSNPLFYRQIEQNILRQNCISYLLDYQNPNTYKQFGLKMYNDNPAFTDYRIV